MKKDNRVVLTPEGYLELEDKPNLKVVLKNLSINLNIAK